MRVDFLPIAIEGGADEESFVDMILSIEKFFEEFVDALPILNFGIEAEGSEVDSKHVKVASERKISDYFEQSSIAPKTEDKVGFLEEMSAAVFILFSQDFPNVFVPHEFKLVAIEEALELFEKISILFHLGAANQGYSLEFLVRFCFHKVNT